MAQCAPPEPCPDCTGAGVHHAHATDCPRTYQNPDCGLSCPILVLCQNCAGFGSLTPFTTMCPGCDGDPEDCGLCDGTGRLPVLTVKAALVDWNAADAPDMWTWAGEDEEHLMVLGLHEPDQLAALLALRNVEPADVIAVQRRVVFAKDPDGWTARYLSPAEADRVPDGYGCHVTMVDDL